MTRPKLANKPTQPNLEYEALPNTYKTLLKTKHVTTNPVVRQEHDQSSSLNCHSLALALACFTLAIDLAKVLSLARRSFARTFGRR